MRAFILLFSVCFVIAVAIISSSSALETPAGVARFREVETTRLIRYQVGSLSVWTTKILLLKNNTNVGFALYACAKIRVRSECKATYVLPRGKIQVAGDVLSRGHAQMLILGGTGAYDKAHGIVQITRPFVTFYFN